MSSPPGKRKKEKEETNISPDRVIRIEVDNVSILYEGYECEVDVQGVSWGICVMRDGDLAVSLYCRPTHCTLWNIDVVAEIALIHSDLSRNRTIEESQTFNHSRTNLHGELMDWDEFIGNDKGFIKNDKITIEVRFWLSNVRGVRTVPHIDFTDPDDPRHDVALMIGGEKIYASKQILAAHSSVFHAMFYGEFADKNKNEIELKDVDRQEFYELLRVIYPSQKKIADGLEEFLLKLGNQFQMTYVIDRVEEFVISYFVSITYKLHIADKYKLFELQEHCFSEMKTEHEFNAVKESSYYDDLSSDMKKLLFERLLSTVRGTSGCLSKEAAGQRSLKLFNNTYIQAWQGSVDMSPHRTMNARWTIIERDGKVMLTTYLHKFLRAHPDCRVDLADEAREWEMWTPCKNGDGTWSFRSHHGTWLSAHRADGIVCAKRHKLKGEKFRLEP